MAAFQRKGGKVQGTARGAFFVSIRIQENDVLIFSQIYRTT